MVDTYTPRQLDYFKSTLVILNAALTDTPLAADPLPLAAAEALAPPPAPTIPEPAAALTLAEAAPVMALASSAVDSEPLPEAITTVAGTPTCAVFFQALPWQADPMAPMMAASAEPSVAAVLTLPVEPLPEPIKPVEGKPSQAFFRALPWQGTTVSVSFTDAALPPAQMPKASKAFFRTLPWQGHSAAPGINSGDFAGIAAIATQTALQAAQRSVGKQGIPAASFFKALPWSSRV
ncbi:hypothetical protein KFZ76_09005 [Methylovulum psychrotolerans]|uniref:hypothetical protein n=1 Tax=Methylovulum psychrotolerans TaxID=1704499 RepID=UPI001BFF31AD|nr:hypothetical protein [Methylovulum psychrotolerans]MBT9097845.1 hypothetical protein [Methylovulum psychrotolerans]